MYLPNVREEKLENGEENGYFEGNLNEKDSEFIRGFDWCAEMSVTNFFDNLFDIFPQESFLGHTLAERLPEYMKNEYEVTYRFPENEPDSKKKRKIVVETYADLLREELLNWIESDRDESIVSMLDNCEE